MTDNKLNDLAMQMVNSMKTMDDFKQIQQLIGSRDARASWLCQT